jgi:hypothetical protein
MVTYVVATDASYVSMTEGKCRLVADSTIIEDYLVLKLVSTPWRRIMVNI